MKYVYFLIRFLVGGLFIFSGVVKAIDPVGTAIKMEEYFHVFTDYIPFLTPLWNILANYALHQSIFMIILEIVLGVSLLLGTLPRLTLALYAAIIGFFTILTGFSAATGKVTDCGCFGDFIKLKPIETFGKDVVLCVLIVFLIAFAKYLSTFFNKKIAYALLTISTIITTWFTFHNYFHLPVIDFRAYKNGTDLIKGKSTEGLDPGEVKTVYTLINTQTKAEKTIDSKEYMSSGIWQDTTWKMDKTRTLQDVIREPQMPTIKDFAIYDSIGTADLSDSLLAIPGYMLWVATYDLENSSPQGFKAINETALAAVKAGIPVIGLTQAKIELANQKAEGIYPFYNLDATPIKTMMRSKPGLMLTKNATVVEKWHYNDTPTFEQLQQQYNVQKTDGVKVPKPQKNTN